ncbi:MAG: hypothetical protein U0271_07930 [Polyangiaceae bacterium]
MNQPRSEEASEVLAIAARQLAFLERVSPAIASLVRVTSSDSQASGVVALVGGADRLRLALARLVRASIHNLRTPLTVVRTNAMLLRTGQSAFTSEELDMLSDIEQASTDMDRLLRELAAALPYDLSGLTPKPEEVVVSDIVSGLARRWRGLRGESVTVVASEADQARVIYADRLALDRLLDELLGIVALVAHGTSLTGRVGFREGALEISLTASKLIVDRAAIEDAFAPRTIQELLRGLTEKPDERTGASRAISQSLHAARQLAGLLGGELKINRGDAISFDVTLPQA